MKKSKPVSKSKALPNDLLTLGKSPAKLTTWEWMILICIMLVVVFIRFRLLDTPLERDEGDYAYHGQLLLDGVNLDDELIRKRFPVIFFIYSIIMVLFGQTAKAIHTGLLLANLATIYLIFRWIRKMFNPVWALTGAVVFAALMLNYKIDGFSANREHFVILIMLGGVMMMYKSFKKRKPWMFYISGFLFGLAFTVKEVGLFFIIFGGLWLIKENVADRKMQWKPFFRQLGMYAAGVFTPYLLIVVYFLSLGVFQEFWLRSFVLNKEYASTMSSSIGIDTLKVRATDIFNSAPLLWLLFLIGLMFSWFESKIRKYGFLLVSFLLLSFLSLVPGWYFRSHYFILFMPVATIFIVLGIYSIARFLHGYVKTNTVKMLVLLLLLIGIFHAFYIKREYLFNLPPNQAIRINYGANPFPEARVIGNYIQQNSYPESRILVLGSEPELYFYAHRKAAVEAIYMYDLMLETEYASQLQQITIEQAEKNSPEFIILFNMPVSWQGFPNSDQSIIEWSQKYLQEKQFVTAGVVDLLPDENGGTQYIFGNQAMTYKPRSTGHIFIFRRNIMN
jgi:Dolichyl-phosphate-mannose-protein mannosyltransferase